MKFMNQIKKFFVGAFNLVKDSKMALVGATGAVLAGATSAKADLTTDMATITTAATDGVNTVSTSQATVIASVFGLILLAVGAKWIFGSIKSR